MSTKKTALTASLTTAITGLALVGSSAAAVRAVGHDTADERAALEALSATQSRNRDRGARRRRPPLVVASARTGS